MDRVFECTQGQPYLVNAVADEIDGDLVRLDGGGVAADRDLALGAPVPGNNCPSRK